MDAIFKALSDETRRLLLDRLRERDGQTSGELEATPGLSGMTRFGVMKHLNVLEAASLITTRKVGRFKYHYLNAAPLQMVVDRWIEPLTQQPLARVMMDLKAELEGPDAMAKDPVAPPPATKPAFVLETFIRTTPEKLWEALTSPELSSRYYIAGAAIGGTFKPGGTYAYRTGGAEGPALLSGKILAADPPHRLEMTFEPGWMGPAAKASRNVFEIKQVAGSVKLTVLHFDLPPEQEGLKEGWAKIAASLKSLLETGEALSFG
jgi:uncharacterized protein YndB with AHSA1/START domain/DNA-binding transcriptional ArsR family regulator